MNLNDRLDFVDYENIQQSKININKRLNMNDLNIKFTSKKNMIFCC